MKNRRFTNEENEFILKNGEYYGVVVCANKLNRTVRSISGKMKRLLGHAVWKCSASEDEITSLTFDEKWKPLNFDFATTKEKKELAYFIGYFWADGYVDKSDGLVVEIAKDDYEDIAPIFNKLATFQRYHRNRDGRKEQSTFRYQSDENNTELLHFLGKYPKSTESHEKVLGYIPEEFRAHFLRGLFDGDGCLYITKTKYTTAQLSITSCYDMDWSFLVEFLKTRYDITFRVSRKLDERSKYSQIRSTNIKEIKSFLEKLYKDNDGIWLNRKYDKVNFILTKRFSSITNSHTIKEKYLILTFDKKPPILIKKGDNEIPLYKNENISPRYKVGADVVDKNGNIFRIHKIILDEESNTIFYCQDNKKMCCWEHEIIGEYIKDLKIEELNNFIKLNNNG